ncbi:11584_t:CDS:2 [Ambispora leptoticha]|uniref:11584_t:CDS:1 n=1 Tax=Ambispora leptoticha TaxID=144679 RepID=A0A9N9H2L7_9GLOM|nr:11584_t:CDS:2 [Ambispora leptoticha]
MSKSHFDENFQNTTSQDENSQSKISKNLFKKSLLNNNLQEFGISSQRFFCHSQAASQEITPGVELSLDEWTDPSRKSLWNFVIHIFAGRKYLWKLVDLFNQSHTGETLQECIQKIFDELSAHKFEAIVTDGG